jgi:hypothetical protein
MLRPLYPDKVKEFVQRLASENECEVNPNKRGAVRKHMGDILPDDEVRKSVLSWLFFGGYSEVSTTDLSGGQIEALHRWIGAENLDDHWIPNQYTVTEMKWVAKAAMQNKKKMPEMVKKAVEFGGVVTEVKHDD